MDQSPDEILVEFHLARIYGGYYKGRVAVYPHPNAASYDHVTVTPIPYVTARKAVNHKHRVSKATRKYPFGGTPKSQKASVHVVPEEEGEAPVPEQEEILVLEQEDEVLVLEQEDEVLVLEQEDEVLVPEQEEAEEDPVPEAAEEVVNEEFVGSYQVARLKAKLCEMVKED